MKAIKLSFSCLLSLFFLFQQTVSAQAGITWVNQTAATNNSWTSITYGNGLFVAVANTGSGNRVMTSPDGGYMGQAVIVRTATGRAIPMATVYL